MSSSLHRGAGGGIVGGFACINFMNVTRIATGKPQAVTFPPDKRLLPTIGGPHDRKAEMKKIHAPSCLRCGTFA
jgi:hypothetical protein